jgi:hypothetical protein
MAAHRMTGLVDPSLPRITAVKVKMSPALSAETSLSADSSSAYVTSGGGGGATGVGSMVNMIPLGSAISCAVPLSSVRVILLMIGLNMCRVPS